MLAGEPPFTGPTFQAILTKLVIETPRPLRQIRDTVPPALETILQTALAKLPADRFTGAAQFADALTQVPLYPTPSQSFVPVADRTRRRRSALGGSLLVAGALGLGAFGGWRLAQSAPARSPIRLVVPPPNQQVDPEYNWAPTLAIGPAGRELVFLQGGLLQLRALNAFTPRPLTGTEGRSE